MIIDYTTHYILYIINKRKEGGGGEAVVEAAAAARIAIRVSRRNSALMCITASCFLVAVGLQHQQDKDTFGF